MPVGRLEQVELLLELGADAIEADAESWQVRWLGRRTGRRDVALLVEKAARRGHSVNESRVELASCDFGHGAVHELPARRVEGKLIDGVGDQICASWNRLVDWLRAIDGLRSGCVNQAGS